ncbi:MAG: hypothetical protein ACK55I_43355, partial [bacterium]
MKHRFEPIGSKIHLFDQSHRFVAANHKPFPSGPALDHRQAATDGHVKVAVVALQKMPQGLD